MKLYRWFDTDEETPVQIVGVHPLRWRPEWGEPDAMFREVEDAEALAFASQLPEVQALVARFQHTLAIARDALTWCSERDKHYLYTHQLDEDELALAPFTEPAE